MRITRGWPDGPDAARVGDDADDRRRGAMRVIRRHRAPAKLWASGRSSNRTVRRPCAATFPSGPAAIPAGLAS